MIAKKSWYSIVIRDGVPYVDFQPVAPAIIAFVIAVLAGVILLYTT